MHKVVKMIFCGILFVFVSNIFGSQSFFTKESTFTRLDREYKQAMKEKKYSELPNIFYAAMTRDEFGIVENMLTDHGQSVDSIAALKIQRNLMYCDKDKMIKLIVNTCGKEPEIIAELNIHNVLRDNIWSHNTPLVEFLLEKYEQYSWARATLKLDEQLIQAICYNNFAIVKLIIEKYGQDPDAITELKIDQALIMAAGNVAGNLERFSIAKLLFEKYISYHNAPVILNLGEVLLASARCNNRPMIELILNAYSQDPKIIEEIMRSRGGLIFSKIIDHRDYPMVELLLSKCGKDRDTVISLPPLFLLACAMKNNDLEMLELLLNTYEKDEITKAALRLHQAFDHAVEQKNFLAIDYLLKRYGQDDNAITILKIDRAFDHAVEQQNSLAIVYLLKRYGQDDNAITILKIDRAFDHAVEQQNSLAIAYLLKRYGQDDNAITILKIDEVFKKYADANNNSALSTLLKFNTAVQYCCKIFKSAANNNDISTVEKLFIVFSQQKVFADFYNSLDFNKPVCEMFQRALDNALNNNDLSIVEKLFIVLTKNKSKIVLAYICSLPAFKNFIAIRKRDISLDLKNAIKTALKIAQDEMIQNEIRRIAAVRPTRPNYKPWRAYNTIAYDNIGLIQEP